MGTRRTNQLASQSRYLIVDRFGYDPTIAIVDKGYKLSGIGLSSFGLPSNILPIQNMVTNGFWGTNMTPADPFAAINSQLVI